MKTIKIPKLKIEVEIKLRPEVLKRDIKIPKGWRLLKGYEYLYLAENKIIPVYDEDRQWVTLGNQVARVDSDIDVDRLSVYGDSWDDYDDGYAFGVRFCRDLKEGRKQAINQIIKYLEKLKNESSNLCKSK